MRNLLLIVCVLCFQIASAQQPSYHSKLLPTRAKNALKSLPKPNPVANEKKITNTSPATNSNSNPPASGQKTSGLRESETIIGNTSYDLQTNRAIDNRLLRNSDGTLSAVWTTLCPGDDINVDRGSGYNYFDGTSWLAADCHRIEPENRAGFTNIGVTASGKEIVVAHSSTAGGMLITSRPIKGTGAWTENTTVLGGNPDDTWSKMVVGGDNGQYVHAIWNATGVGTNEYCGQQGAIVYSRSADEGATWPIVHQCLAPIDTPFYLGFSADDYAIDAKGNNVAILVGDWTTDLVLLNSTDNGDTWNKQILYQFYKPLYDAASDFIDTDYDGTNDIVLVPSGDGRVAYDNNGKLNVVFSKIYVAEADGAGAVSYYPDLDGGIWYWNEDMGINPPVLIAAAEDLNGNDTLDLPAEPGDGSYFASGTYGTGLSLQPTIGFDANNNIYVTYATYDELADTLGFGSGHRHVYVIASYDQAQTWTTPFDVVPSLAQGGDGEYEEGVFACMAKQVDSKVHIIYQRDPAPGTSLSNLPLEAAWNDNPSDIVYVGVGTDELLSVNAVNTTSFNVSQNTPNPATDQTSINVTLPSNSNLKIEIFDMLGQKVFAVPSSNYSAGVHSIKIDCSKFTPGVYFYEVSSGNEKATKKMIVE